MTASLPVGTFDDPTIVGPLVGVALPGELLFVAAALIWPLGAWIVVAVRGVPRSKRWRAFARAAAAAVVLAVGLAALAVFLNLSNGTGEAFAGFAALLAAGVILIGALVSGLIALALR